MDYIGAYDLNDRSAVAALLGLTNAPQIAAVAQGSPAQHAGVLPGDELLAVDGASVASLFEDADAPEMFADMLERLLLAKPLDKEVHLQLRRKGVPLSVAFRPEAVCAARFIITTEQDINAYTDGANVAVTEGLVAYTQSDDELAVVAAHELGHIVNGDGEPDGLTERRAMEDRADLIAVRLAGCAGYSLEKGLLFGERRARDKGPYLFQSHSHRSYKERGVRMQREALSFACPARPLDRGDG